MKKARIFGVPAEKGLAEKGPAEKGPADGVRGQGRGCLQKQRKNEETHNRKTTRETWRKNQKKKKSKKKERRARRGATRDAQWFFHIRALSRNRDANEARKKLDFEHLRKKKRKTKNQRKIEKCRKHQKNVGKKEENEEEQTHKRNTTREKRRLQKKEEDKKEEDKEEEEEGSCFMSRFLFFCPATAVQSNTECHQDSEVSFMDDTEQTLNKENRSNTQKEAQKKLNERWEQPVSLAGSIHNEKWKEDLQWGSIHTLKQDGKRKQPHGIQSSAREPKHAEQWEDRKRDGKTTSINSSSQRKQKKQRETIWKIPTHGFGLQKTKKDGEKWKKTISENRKPNSYHDDSKHTLQLKSASESSNKKKNFELTDDIIISVDTKSLRVLEVMFQDEVQRMSGSEELKHLMLPPLQVSFPESVNSTV